ncbi:MAG: hypothetical protein HEP71_20590 [Roseivirga sp.]|nr:hypothetical protein [Roseivirga sp.]
MVKTIKGLFLTLGAFLVISCGSDDSGQEEASDLILYKIDYTTHTFEGGVTLSLRRIAGGFNTEIPLEVDKQAPDMTTDGSLAIFYQPTLDQVFQASLSLEGEAEIFFPILIEPGDFLRLETPVTFPAGVEIQSIDGDHSQAPTALIWEAVANLGLTEFVLNEDTQIGLFLYQPSEDPAFSSNWDWILMLYNL